MLVALLSFPLTVYASFVREHAYGLATQSFAGWLRDQLVALVVSIVLGALIAPVFIAPLLNRYTPLTDARIRDPILRLARANGVAAEDVWVVDASRQSTRVSERLRTPGHRSPSPRAGRRREFDRKERSAGIAAC